MLEEFSEEVRGALAQATQTLKNNQFKEPSIEAVSLVANALKLNKISLYLNYNKALSNSEQFAISKLLARRLNHEPLEYLTGYVNFMGLDFMIEPPVLIPRPETEVLVETLVEVARDKKNPIIFDIGTGCGAIGIASLKFLPNARVYASDIIDLRLARRNAIKLKVSERIRFLRGDLLHPFFEESCGKGKADFIVSNPPYIPSSEIPSLQPEIRFFESHTALDGGEDGLFFIRELIKTSVVKLKKSGMLLLEISPEQADTVKKEALKYFESVDFIKDFFGRTRVFLAKYPKLKKS
ncbi:peptide chain release factor N(5)-glutamine methyltransferase [candidate division WOR-3 bacterium]|nr:peptide chain release factor N(5)-glutamine methyltransferase [candidate division WOR-3 bacterium]